MKFLLSVIFSTSLLIAQVTFTPSVDKRRAPLEWIRQTADPDSLVDVIIEFKEEPYFVAQLRSLAKVNPTFYQERFGQFRDELSTFAVQRAAGGPSATAEIRRTYYRSFFGVSARMSYAMSIEASRLPYVKKIHRNKTMRTMLHKSVQQIRASEVWNVPGSTGTGVTVGIIDTGIDYLHPALGGGIGSSFKVAGGYDFANNDNDPMDDNGHGTHVAGIVAANSTDVKGVAPSAKLYAFKVLNAEGGGKEEDIIAAIERTVDPNNDGSMSDRLDIVNMSLGSEDGDPEDAASTAVDHATSLGVTFVIAAGNSGNAELIEGKENNFYFTGMETIGSPGTSRSAITVGAVDSLDELAYFSSKGPTRGAYGIKPEVVAPGVNIRSLFPSNSTLIESGTSMASPMVAGVAALLKSHTPSLTPAQIKSKIVNASVDLGMKPMLQGAGRVDAVRAIRSMTSAMPTVISFGLDDPAQSTWVRTDTVSITNLHTASQQYGVTFSGGGTGITVAAVPSNFTLAPGAVQNVLVTISVNNTIVPIVDEDIILYNGMMHVRTSADTLRLPWSFARTTRMLLTFSQADPFFVGGGPTSYLGAHYNRKYSRIRWLDAVTAEISGPNRETYSFGVYYPAASALVLKEGVQFTGANTFSFPHTEAVHTVHFNGSDENGSPLAQQPNVQRSMRVTMPYGFFFTRLKEGVTSLKVSPASAEFEFHPMEALLDLQPGKRIVIPQYSTFKGIASDVSVSTAGGSYFHQHLRFILPNGVTSTRFYTEVIDAENVGNDFYYNTALVGIDTVQAMNGIAEADLYLMKPVDARFQAAAAFHTNSSYAKDALLDMSTRYLSVVNDSLLMGLPDQALATSYRSPEGATLTFGESPVHVLNLSYNNAFGPSIHFAPYFMGGLFEFRYSDLNSGHYAIYNSAGVKLTEDALNVFPRMPFNTDPGKYRLEITAGGYQVKNAQGTVTLRNDVDLTKEVPDAPVLTSFRLMNSFGRASSSFEKNEAATLTFSSKVFAYPYQLPLPESTTVHYRMFKSTAWQPLTTVLTGADAEKEGAIFSASLAQATANDSAAFDLKIRMVDSYGNAVEQILSPAFSVGNWMDDGTTDVETEGPAVPVQFALHQNYPNPFNPATTISYQLSAIGHTSLVIYDAIGREAAVLVNEVQQAGSYAVLFDGARLTSGVYFARLSSGGRSQMRKMLMVK